MEQKGMTFDHDFYVDVGKKCRTENFKINKISSIS